MIPGEYPKGIIENNNNNNNNNFKHFHKGVQTLMFFYDVCQSQSGVRKNV